MAALLRDALCTAHATIPGRDRAWIRRDGRMARNGSQEQPFLALTGLVHDDMTTALPFLQDESSLLPLGGVAGRQAECRCTMPMESIRWRGHASDSPAGVSPLARRCLCTQRRYSRCPPKRSGNARHGEPRDEERGPGYLKGWTTDIGPLAREHSLNQGMLFFSWLHRQTLRKTTSFASTVNTPRSSPKPRIRADRHEKTRKP